MDVFSFCIGALAGWLVQLAIDHLFYRRSPEFDRALRAAEARGNALHVELVNLRRAHAENPTDEDAVAARNALLTRISTLEAELVQARQAPAPAQADLADRDVLLARIATLEAELAQSREKAASLPSAREVSPIETFEIALSDAAARQRALEARLMEVETDLAMMRYSRTAATPPDSTFLTRTIEERDREIANLRTALNRSHHSEDIAS
ncbi:MAG: hypothetical protein C4320_07160 [Armatimonadota bacterium]